MLRPRPLPISLLASPARPAAPSNVQPQPAAPPRCVAPESFAPPWPAHREPRGFAPHLLGFRSQNRLFLHYIPPRPRRECGNHRR
jgi:hypothetical protein